VTFAEWKKLPRKTGGCYQRATHRHWILDKDDPQFTLISDRSMMK